MFQPFQVSSPPFNADLVVLGVVAQLLAGLFLSAAAGKGRSKHLLLEALGGTPVKGGNMVKFLLGFAVGLGFVLFRDHVMPVLQRVVGCIQ